MSMQDIVAALNQVPSTRQKLKKSDFDLVNGSDSRRVEVASYAAESTIALREEAVRMMFVTVDQFQTDGNASNTETFSLSSNIIPTNNTADLVLFKQGSRVQPDMVDYSADEFDYTDSGSNNYLHAYYVFRDPTQIEVVKEAPKSQGRVQQTLFDDITSVLHERDQNKTPPTINFAGDSPLTPVIPRKWELKIYQDGPTAIEWNDSDTSNSQSTAASNAIVSLPINRARREISGLARAVKADVIR